MPNIRILKILGENSICAKPEFHKILVVGLGFIRKLTTTKPRAFSKCPTYASWKSLGKNSPCAKPEFHKILGVGHGFIRKLTTTKPRVFPSAQHMHLENPWEKQYLRKDLSESWLLQSRGFFQVPNIRISKSFGKKQHLRKARNPLNPRGWSRIYQKADYYKT